MSNRGCQRCSKETAVTTMSWLNQQMICLDCAEKEEGHPKYKEAREAERKAVQAGEYNSKFNLY